MKKSFSLIIIICAAMVPRIGQAQAQIDSSWIENRNGSFFQARRHLFPDGGEKLEVTLIGDTATTVSKFISNMRDEANGYAADAAVVSNYRGAVTEMIRFGLSLKTMLGASPYDSLRNIQKDITDVGVWGINSTAIRFRVTAGGLFQYRTDTTTTWRRAAFLGGVIRLYDLNGYHEDLYRKSGSDVWSTINKRYRLAKIGSRPLYLAEPYELIVSEKPQRTTQLQAGGIVLINGKKFKYNSRAKKWDELE